jgi:hypothetical protein
MFMSLWLLLKGSEKGYALPLHPAPTEQDGKPRPFSRGGEGEKFRDFALHWLPANPVEDPVTGKTLWRLDLDKNDPLQLSAQWGGALAYHLLYHHAENPVREQCSARFQLDEAELLAQGGSKNIDGPSGDLLFALAVIVAASHRLDDYPTLAATGELDKEGRVHRIEGLAQKLEAFLAAIAKATPNPPHPEGGDTEPKALFFYPRANEDDIPPSLRKTASNTVKLIALERLGEALPELGIQANDYWMGNPYRGFGYFDTEHRRIYFGRRAERIAAYKELWKRAEEGHPGLMVIGSSGRGKSSFVRAGLIPDLQNGLDWEGEDSPIHQDGMALPVFYHVWRLPQDQNLDIHDAQACESRLAQALRQAWAHLPELGFLESPPSAETPQTTAGQPLAELADQLAADMPQDRRFVFVIDQMEELFSFRYPPATVTAFGEFLQRLQALGVWPLCTLRSEYFPTYLNTIPLDVFGTGYALPKMHATALEDAIRKPAKLAKLDFETDPATGINLAAHIRDEALAGGEDMLPMLGFVLSELYEDSERVKNNTGLLTWQAYRKLGGQSEAKPAPQSPAPPASQPQPLGLLANILAKLNLRKPQRPEAPKPLLPGQLSHIGGLSGAISHHAEKLLASCTRKEQEALPKVLIQLVHLSEEGNQVLRQRAHLSAFPEDTPQHSLIRKLIDGRLLVSHIDPQTQEAQVELVHDCLLTAWNKVGEAIEQHRELLEEKRKLSNAAQHWARSGRPERLLLSRSKEVLQAEVLIECSGNDLRDPKTQEFIKESIRLTRTGFRMFWVLLCLGCLAGSLYGIFIQNTNSPILNRVLHEIPIQLLLSPIWSKGLRSFSSKSYISTLHSELMFCYGYLVVSVIFIILLSLMIISSNGMTGMILFPIMPTIVITYIRRIIFNRKYLKKNVASR